MSCYGSLITRTWTVTSRNRSCATSSGCTWRRPVVLLRVALEISLTIRESLSLSLSNDRFLTISFAAYSCPRLPSSSLCSSFWWCHIALVTFSPLLLFPASFGLLCHVTVICASKCVCLSVCRSGIHSLAVLCCQSQYKWLPEKTPLRNYLLCVEWDIKVKLYLLSQYVCVHTFVSTARNLWRFLQHVTKDVHQLTEYVSRNQDKVTLLLRKPADKLWVELKQQFNCYDNN